MNYVKLSWKDIDKMCDIIAEQITNKKIQLNVIIGVGRGGLIPARILSDRLNIPDIYMFNIKLYKGVALRNNKPTVQTFNHDIQNKSVILVDDIMDSGITLEKAYNEIISKRPSLVKVATLICKDFVINKPSFFAKFCKKEDWIIYPWEKEEFKNESK